MDSREKAIELVDRIRLTSEDTSNYVYESTAIECALILVDEILKSVPKHPSISITMPHFEATVYWEEVKQEINKLK